jgi:hypothetical protein
MTAATFSLSRLHVLDEAQISGLAEAHRRGIARMERDLKMGPLQGTTRYLLLWGKK